MRRRHARGRDPLPTAIQVFGSLVQREYDCDFSAITTKGGTVTSFGALGADPLTLLQGGAVGLQPPHIDQPLASYMTGDGVAQQLVSGAGNSLSGGDICLISLVRKLSTPALSGVILSLGSAAQARQQLRIAGATGFLGGVIRDSVGSDAINSTVTENTLFHTLIIYNSVGVRRCLWADGGAGVNGVRTTATNVEVNQYSSMFGGTVMGASLAHCEIAHSLVLKNAPSIAKINEWGQVLQQRYREKLALAPWATAT